MSEAKSTRAGKRSLTIRAEEQYAGAFARVRLVRAWVAAAAALVGMLMAFEALLERLTR